MTRTSDRSFTADLRLQALHNTFNCLEPAKTTPQLIHAKVGDWVALHWDYAYRRLTPTQLRHLVDIDGRHRAVVNAESTHLASRIEG